MHLGDVGAGPGAEHALADIGEGLDAARAVGAEAAIILRPDLALGGVLVPMGSAGVKAMAVVRGQADAYVHGGGQYEWDSAAPVVVAAAAGLHTSRLDGSPLVYNQRDVLLPDLVVCQPAVAARLLEAIAAL
jgi:fructose-1,6-bisphosphatase/inositol monophosphatase family enzyme